MRSSALLSPNLSVSFFRSSLVNVTFWNSPYFCFEEVGFPCFVEILRRGILSFIFFSFIFFSFIGVLSVTETGVSVTETGVSVIDNSGFVGGCCFLLS